MNISSHVSSESLHVSTRITANWLWQMVQFLCNNIPNITTSIATFQKFWCNNPQKMVWNAGGNAEEGWLIMAKFIMTIIFCKYWNLNYLTQSNSGFGNLHLMELIAFNINFVFKLSMWCFWIFLKKQSIVLRWNVPKWSFTLSYSWFVKSVKFKFLFQLVTQPHCLNKSE